jgi:hypothetical protein
MQGPLHEVLERLDAGRGDDELRVGASALPAPAGPAWVAVDDLLVDDERFEAIVDRHAASWRTDRRDVAGAALLSDLGFALLLRGAAAFLAARRIPRLTAGGVALRLHGDGWVEHVALGPALACLPGDAAASAPGAEVVPDEEALLRLLLEDFDAHHEPLVERVAARCRRPRAALWRHGADTVAEAFLWAGEVLDDRAAAWAWGERAVAAAPERLRAHAGFRRFAHAGVEQVGRVRAQCCLHYRTGGATYCFSCPLKDDDHRLAMLAARAAGELAA